jgi:endonuclease/exonuclease/phosphatase family metal-dependent hydrolase
MKIVTYNIRYGLGLDNQFNLKRIADTVRGADVIALQEVEKNWRRSGMVDQPEEIGKLLPEYFWSYCPSFDVDASESDEIGNNGQGQVINRRRQFGTMLLSRWPIISVRNIAFPQIGTLNMLNMATGALEGVIETPLGTLQVYSIHLSSISTRERLLQIERLLTSRNQLRLAGGVMTLNGDYSDPVEAQNFELGDWSNGEPHPPVPQYTMIMGDFNSTEESPEYIQFVGPSDPLYGRGMHSEDLVDSWAVAKEKTGDSLTWWPDPVDRAPGYPLRLDYCFISTELSSLVSKAWVDTEATGSDHKPYWFELNS